MFENLMKFFKKFNKKQEPIANSKDAAKERLHLVLMQDRANVSADFLELMKQEIIEVIKKYIDVDEKAIDVRLTNKENEDGTNGAPALYANIPILNIKNEARKLEKKQQDEKKQNNDQKVEENKERSIEEKKEISEEKEQREQKDTNEKIENSNNKQNNEEKEEKRNSEQNEYVKIQEESGHEHREEKLESKEKIKSKNN